MPVDLKGYRVFIASPGGLDNERTAFRDTIEEHNRSDGLARSVQFIPVGWEETLGGQRRPQSIINDEVQKCDYFVMVLHDRWGTPPGQDGNKKYSSGTEEEYNVALECLKGDIAKFPMRQIIIFFKALDVSRMSDPGEQLKKVLDFRKKLESEKTHLFHVYDTVSSFEKWVRRYLMQWIRDDENGNTAKIKSPVAPYDESAEQTKEMAKLEILEKKPEPLKKEIGELLKKAEKFANEGKITEAETMYSEAVVRSNAPAAINAYGIFLRRLGRLGQAEVMYKRVMEIAENIKNEEWKSIALGNLGNIYSTFGDLIKAEEMCKKSLEINEKLGRLEGMANQYGNLGLIYQSRGELKKAADMHKKSLAIEEKLGHLEGMASDYGNLGVISCKHGDLDEAEKMLKKSLAIEEKLGDLEGIATDYGNLGIVYQKRGNLDEAEKMYKKSLVIDEKLGHLEGMANHYGNLGIVYKIRGDLDNAEKMYKKSLEIDEKLGRLEGMASDYGNMGFVYKNRGDLEKAKEYWIKARDLYQKIGMPEAKKMQEWIDGLKN